MSAVDEPVLLERPRRSFYERYEATIIGGLSVLVVVAIWQWAWSAGKISPLFFTGPSQIVRRFAEDWSGGHLKQDIAYSGVNFVIGVGAAILVGVIAGVVIGWYRRVAMVFEPFLITLYSTPRVALIPLVLIWFGIGIWSKVFIVFINAFFPVLINTIGGVKATDRDLLRAARAYCASDWQIFTTVVVPGAVPFILTGIRQAVALGLIGVVVGEMFGGSEGIGYMVTYGGQTFQTDSVFVGVAIIAVAGITLSWLAERLERHFSRWRPER
ncbi:MAG TPA: ABC transporter permease [Vicinamibacterales bacterium]|nr:ABC transporter permease [Vicinamibacterales bacterium]